MKLPSQKYRQGIASVINSIQRWGHKWHEEKHSKLDNAKFAVWYHKAVLELFNEYGVELPALEDCEANIAFYESIIEREERLIEERAAQVEEVAAEQAELRPELEAIGSSVNPEDYVCIALWGQELGSYAYYIELEQAKASREGAPLTALFKRPDGTWATLQEMKNLELKAKLEAQLEEELAA